MEMLVDVGCKYVITGHSERRDRHGEPNGLVRRKTTAAQTGGLIPILCVGEKLEDRERGVAVEIILRQLRECLPDRSSGGNIVVAYEPVWAIGTGMNATVVQVEEAHDFIRNTISNNILGSENTYVNILYGGSVNPNNCRDLLRNKEVDGALVGGASLNISSFCDIIKAASSI